MLGRPPTRRAVTVYTNLDISNTVLEGILSEIDYYRLGPRLARLSFRYSLGISNLRLLPRPTRMSKEGYKHSTLV